MPISNWMAALALLNGTTGGVVLVLPIIGLDAGWLIIPILIDLGCLLANFLNALDEAIAITVGIVSDDAHATVNFDQLLPVRHLARTIKLHSFEFVGVAVSPLQFITPVLVKVSDLLYQQLLVVLNHKGST
jgi:hypothetical protein